MPAPVAAAYFHDEITREMLEEDNNNGNSTAADDATTPYPRVTIVASHEGQVGRASHFRSALQRLSGGRATIELAVLSKNKLNPGETHYAPTLVGTVKGRRCILVDDICNTGTTLVSNIQTLQREGAASIYAWATHGIFGASSQAPERLQAIPGDTFRYLLVSNSVHNSGRHLPSKIRSLNVAPLLAEAVARALHDQSISGILDLQVLDQAQGQAAAPRYDD